MRKKGFSVFVPAMERRDGRNIACIALERDAKKRREEVLKKINRLNMQFCSVNTSHGDEADCGYKESMLHSNIVLLTSIQKELSRINAFIECLQDPGYEGLCKNELCEDDIPLSRILTTFSPLCVKCAQ